MDPQPTSQAPSTPTPAAGAVILIILIVAGVSFIYVNSLFGLTDYWAGFLFLTYWMAAEALERPARTVGRKFVIAQALCVADATAAEGFPRG